MEYLHQQFLSHCRQVTGGMPVSNISMLLYYLDSQIVSALAGAFSCIYSPFQALSNTSSRSGVQPRLVAPDLAYHLRISLGIQ